MTGTLTTIDRAALTRTSLPSDPAQLHEMLSTLSPADKDALFAHDNYIGNRDGLPVVDRDHYNRIKLDELSRAEACGLTVSDRLVDLQAVRDTIDEDPNRMLMLLDTQSGAQTHAAVAVGNPDTAGTSDLLLDVAQNRPSCRIRRRDFLRQSQVHT